MTDQVTNENILRTCIVCQEEKETSKFRLNRTSCRKCCSKSQNAVLKNKNYLANMINALNIKINIIMRNENQF